MANHVLLEKITVGASNIAYVTFNSIPQTGYTDLKITMSAALTAADVDNAITLNGSTTKSSGIRLYGNGSNKGSDGAVGGGLANPNFSTYTANTFGNTEYYFPNYTSTFNKLVSIDATTENNATQSYLNLSTQTFALTSSITSIKLTPNSGSYLAGSTFYLYGISNSVTTPTIAPWASGGDIIQTDGTYWYHAFLNGTQYFTPAKTLTCDYLVIAAGGGGGSNAYSGGTRSGGGGGAGGFRTTVATGAGWDNMESKLILSPGTSYTVTVGTGGTGGVVALGDTAAGTNGGDSTFHTITAIGGGGGGGSDTAGASVPSAGARSGGSGGGATGGNFAGSGTTLQGYSGGLSYHSAGQFGGGGGGGAGIAGTDATAGAGGAGGEGIAVSSFASATGTGVSNYYAGGGGGSGPTTQRAGGLGGGGAANGGSGIANTGGGGSASKGGTGGSGGSGIVIVRYAI